MRRLICAVVVRVWLKQIFSWYGSFFFYSSFWCQRKSATFAYDTPWELFMFSFKWTSAWQNQQNDLWVQWRLKSAQSDQRLCCPHEKTLGPQLPIERTAKTLVRLSGCPGWFEFFFWAQGSFCWFCHAAAQIMLILKSQKKSPNYVTFVKNEFNLILFVESKHRLKCTFDRTSLGRSKKPLKGQIICQRDIFRGDVYLSYLLILSRVPCHFCRLLGVSGKGFVSVAINQPENYA